MLEVETTDRLPYDTIGFVRSNPFIQNDLRNFGLRLKNGGGQMATELSSQRYPNNNNNNTTANDSIGNNVSNSLNTGIGSDEIQNKQFAADSISGSIGFLKAPVATLLPEQAPVPVAVSDLLLTTNAVVSSNADDDDRHSDLLDSDVEYGPGIVQKLREKFTKLSRNLTSTARISRHLTRKRFPSVDDILCTSTANRHFQSVGSRHHSRRDGSGPLLRSQTVLPIESFDISHSGSDSNFCQERIAAAARQTQGDKAAIDSAVTAESLDYEIMPIRALKEKFESYSRELVIPKTVDKNAKSAFRRNNRSHSATTRRSNMLMTRSYSLNDDDTDDDTAAFGSDDEPEFIRVQRRLKNSKRELHDRNLKVVSSKVDHRYTPDKKSSPAVTKPADVTLPKFSSSARLIVYPPTHIFEDAHSSPRPASILDLDNPPDPDSARASPLNQQNIQPEYTFSLSPNSGFDRSPPPEEPNPPECYTEKATETVYSPKTTESASYTKRANVECQDNAVLSKPQVPVDDGSGIEEMQKLLSKFNVIREQKNQSDTVVEASASPNTASATSPPQPVVVSSSSEKPLTKFVATKPKPRSTKAAFVTNIHSTFSTDSSELLRTRKSLLVAVPKPRDFLPQNTRVELLVHPKQSPLNEQLSGTNTETSLHHSPNSDAQTTKRNASIVTVTADDDSALRSSPRQLLLSEANNKTASTSESQLNNNTTVSKPQTAAATIIDVVPATKVDNTRSFGIVEEENTGDNVASNSASSPDKFNSQDGQRKSLSSKFFESRGQFSTVGNESDKKPLEHIARRPKPYGDDATEIYEKSATDFATGSLLNEQTEESNTEASKTDLTTDIRTGNVSSLLEKFSKQQIVENDDKEFFNGRPSSLSNYMSFTAGDGNPVRHSLINLVMEEDVPLLMEAMAEKLNFEFEDLSALPSSSTEGIIRTSQQRKKQRNASRIGFSDSPPAVFSYPDESTATEFSEWHPGEDISFEEYQKICEEERQKYEDERLTNKWQTPFNANEMSQIFSVSEQPTVGDFALGVTSRISYSTSPPYNPNNAFATNTNISLIAGK